MATDAALLELEKLAAAPATAVNWCSLKNLFGVHNTLTTLRQMGTAVLDSNKDLNVSDSSREGVSPGTLLRSTTALLEYINHFNGQLQHACFVLYLLNIQERFIALSSPCAYAYAEQMLIFLTMCTGNGM